MFSGCYRFGKSSGQIGRTLPELSLKHAESSHFQALELFFLNLSDTGLPLNVLLVFHSFSEELFPYVLGPSFRSYT